MANASKRISKRRVVERIFEWFNFNRRLAIDYEAINKNIVALVHLAMIKIILNRKK